MTQISTAQAADNYTSWQGQGQGQILGRAYLFQQAAITADLDTSHKAHKI